MTKTSNFEFKTFTTDTFQATARSWNQDVEQGLAFPAEVEQNLYWAQEHIKPDKDGAVAYGVFPTNSDVAEAICEVVVKQNNIRSKWIKMLRVPLRPRADAALNSLGEDSSNGMKTALEIFVQCSIGLLELGVNEKASTIKIYGRTQAQTDFLRFLGIELEKITHNPVSASMQGRFLVIEPRL